MTLPNFAITGEMRSGKDAVAEYLEAEYRYTRFAFGDSIRDICRRLYPDKFADGKKPRALLQNFGEFARTVDKNVWVNLMFRRIEDFLEKFPYWGQQYDYDTGALIPIHNRIVISDVRQPHEVEALRDRGYVLIRVTAPEALRIDRAIKSGDTFNLRDLTHDTESHARSFEVDYEIVNDGTLAELYAKVDEVIRNVSA